MEFEKNKIQWFEYDLLSGFSNLFGATFLRHGGTSEGVYEALNASDAVGDNHEVVKVNRELIRKQIGASNLVFAKQVHGDSIIEVNTKNFAHLPEADGLITKEKNIGLAITHADCQAAIFFDPKLQVIAAVHAGWKGLVKNIYQKTVDVFVNRFNSKAEDILVCVSPSLCPLHAEFKNYKTEFPENFWSYQKEKFHFDLWEIAQMQLLQAGILEKNIEIASVCNCCNENDYYSYRRDKDTGRNATVIALKS